MRKNKDKRNRNKFILFILFIITIILLILSLIGCKKYHSYKDRQLLLSLPRLNNEGYWIDKDNNKLTDKLSTYKDINIYDYYKIYDSQYNKSYNNFYNEFNHNNLDYTYKVEFYNFDYSLYDSKDYKLLNKLVFPKNPNKEGYIFKGWKLKDNPLNKDLLFTDKNILLVDDNLKFESIFIKSIPPYNEYVKVEFYVDDKIFHQSIIKNGGKINEIEAPNKENYKFLGWYDEFDNKFNFNSNLTRDLKLKAKYFNLTSYNNSVKKHNVNYLDEDGNIYQTIEV